MFDSPGLNISTYKDHFDVLQDTNKELIKRFPNLWYDEDDFVQQLIALMDDKYDEILSSNEEL